MGFLKKSLFAHTSVPNNYSVSAAQKSFFLFLLLFFFNQGACGILVPDQGLNSHLLHLKCRGLITGPSGKFLFFLFFYVELTYYLGFPDASVDEEFTSSTGDVGDASLIPGLGRSPGGDHGNPFQCSCLGNPMDRGAWWATAHMVA